MKFSYKQEVEICSTAEDGSPISFEPAKVLAAVGKTRFIVEYQARFSHNNARLLIAAVDGSEIRPKPPCLKLDNFAESALVNVYLNGVWWAGRVTREVDPNCYVRLNRDGGEVHCAFYRVRLHLDFQHHNWVIPPKS